MLMCGRHVYVAGQKLRQNNEKQVTRCDDRLAELEGIVSYCRKYDLDCSIDAGRSWHFPGQTLQVEMTAGKQSSKRP